jgi:multicomponent Na+:H+ antiporter subunit E
MRAVSLTAFLFAFWVALSGHYTPLLVTAGLISAVVCALAAVRARTLDAEGHPASLLVGAITYWPWLVWEMLKSAVNVTRIVLDPRLPISPSMITTKASQRTPGGLATYANSITLTPGTLTVGIEGQEFTIHALSAEGADDLERGRMDARVTRFEGGR